MPTIKTSDGVEIYYQDLGQGKPLVLIHGWPLNSESWEYQLTQLPHHGIRCIAYDRRGFGKSGKPWDGYDYDTFAADLNALLEALDLRDVTLAGFSMGGGEVARYLTRYKSSGRVSKVALLGSVVPFLLKTQDNPDGVDKSVFDGIVDGLKKDRPQFLAEFNKKFYGVGTFSSPVSQGILDWSSYMALAASPKATLDCVRAFSETDFRPDLGSFTVPTLVIHGDEDATVPYKLTGKLVSEKVPGAQLKVYKGAPHGLFYTNRDEVNRDLAEFVLGRAS